jgi:hypothetical protein
MGWLRVIVRVIAYLWATPTTLGGLLFLVPMWALGQLRPMRWRDGVWEWGVVPRSWLWRRYSVRGWSGTTLGYCVFYSPGMERRRDVVIHERRHVWQVLWFGPLFFPLYAVCHLIWGYRANPFERDAYAWERRTHSPTETG